MMVATFQNFSCERMKFFSYLFLVSCMYICNAEINSICSKCRCQNNMVDCSDARLHYIPGDLPKNTKVLNVSGNSYPCINSSSFLNISTFPIRELVLRNCLIKTISNDAFKGLKYIKILDLSQNTMRPTELNNGLESLQNSQLEVLNVSSMKMPNLSDLRFDFTKELHNISLRDNKLSYVDTSSFSALSRIRNVDLSINSIQNFQITGLWNLTVLNLTFNQLPRFPNFCDDNNISLVPNLTELRIGINFISNTRDVKIQGHCLPNLKYLNLSFNPIRIISNNSFSTFPSLQKLRLENLLAFDIRFEEAAFNVSTLKSLYIGNTIRVSAEDFEYNLFSFCPSLTTLDISNWHLINFDEKKLEEKLYPLSNLSKLVLSNTRINFMPSPRTLSNLNNLNLQGNYIREIDKSMFANCTRLEKLNMRKNHLSIIGEKSFPPTVLQNIKSLDLSYNPYSCTCELKWFIQWMKIKGNEQKLLHFPHSYLCDSPEMLRKKNETIQHYDPSVMDCQPTVLMVISVCCCVFIIVFIFVLIRKFRWDIKYHLRRLRKFKTRTKGKYQSIQYSDEYMYDGFVAYNTDDRKWVMSQMIETLERKYNYKLCLYERDFLPGDVTVEQISKNIHESRKFILVLSNNFAASQWCQYETLLAHHTLAEEGNKKLILILLEDIKSTYITSSLKVLLQSIPLVTWTLNICGKKLFWEKMVELLDKE